MSSELFKKFSEELKTAREKKNITLQQISGKTKINIKFLESIELGNFDIIDEVYIRAFLREYAQIIDLDGLDILKKYEKCKSGVIEGDEVIPKQKEKDNITRKVEGKKDEKPEKNNLNEDIKATSGIEEKNDLENKDEEESSSKAEDGVYKPEIVESENTHKKEQIPTTVKEFDVIKMLYELKGKTVVIGSIVAGLFLIFIIVYFAFIKDSKPHIVSERPYEEVIEEQAQKYETKSNTSLKEKSFSIDSLSLVITATDTSWVRVVMDDSRVEEFILLPNLRKQLRAGKDFDILLGNSGGIGLFLNEESLNFIGRKGGVRNIIVDKNGYRAATTSESSRNE